MALSLFLGKECFFFNGQNQSVFLPAIANIKCLW